MGRRTPGRISDVARVSAAHPGLFDWRNSRVRPLALPGLRTRDRMDAGGVTDGAIPTQSGYRRHVLLHRHPAESTQRRIDSSYRCLACIVAGGDVPQRARSGRCGGPAGPLACCHPDGGRRRLFQAVAGLKKGFTRRIAGGSPSPWQPRFWEHTIRDAIDLQRHIDYVHINPMKHGLVSRLCDWPHSSFHRYVRDGLLSADWAGIVEGDDIGE